MQKRTAHIAAAAVGGCLAAALLAANFQLGGQVSSLQGSVNTLESQLNGVTDQLNALSGTLSDQLQRAGSLLSRSDAALSYEDKGFRLTVSVVPKEVRAGESLSLWVGAQSAPLTLSGSAYTGALALPMANNYTPVVRFTSPAGERREALATVYAGEALSAKFLAEPAEDDRLTVTLTAEYSQTQADLEDSTVEGVLMTDGAEGTHVPATSLGGGRYELDLAGTYDPEVETELALYVTLPGGAVLRGDHAAYFDPGGHQSYVGGELYPVLDG